MARHDCGTDLPIALIDFDGDHRTFRILFAWPCGAPRFAGPQVEESWKDGWNL